MRNSMLQAVCEWGSVVVPTLFAFGHLEPAPKWDEDVAVVRALGGVHADAQGMISGSLAAAATLLPIGGRLFRANLAAVVFGAAAAWLVFHITQRLLGGFRPSPWDPLLALVAALTLAFTPAWHQSMLAIGGAAASGALVLAGIRLLTPDLRWLSLGLVLGVAMTERLEAAGMLALMAAVHAVVRVTLPRVRDCVVLGLAAASAALLCLLPLVLEPFVSSSGLSLGLRLELPERTETLHGVESAGLYLLGLGAFGAFIALSHVRTRPLGAMLCTGALLGWLSEGPTSILVGLAGVAACSALGIRAALTALRASSLPLAKPARRLAVVFHVGALLMDSEAARQAGQADRVSAARDWSDEAFEGLPPNSMLLVDSPEAAWRLWAARLTSGTRPDVVLVPRALLGTGALAHRLLELEPRLDHLLRDVALDGVASEFALSRLADARPVRVELDPRWNRQVQSHLAPDGLWFRFAPHPLGHSDRKHGFASMRLATRRVIRSAKRLEGQDTRTLSRLVDDLIQQAAVAKTLRDTSHRARIERTLKRIAPADSRVRALRTPAAQNMAARE